MTAFELWYCDWHSASGPESDADVISEDQARDDGWVRIERYADVPSALGGDRTWRERQVRHVCPGCLKDPDCLTWIEDRGFKGYFPEDAEALAAANARETDGGVEVSALRGRSTRESALASAPALLRTCACGCGRQIKRSRRQAYALKSCRAQVLRAGPRRFAYADPPYPGNSARLYGHHPDYAGEVDHEELIARLVDEFPDGWALSTGSINLRDVIALCPGDVRVGVWTKPLTSLMPTASVQFAWEPLIWRGGRPRSLDDGIVNDWVNVSPPQHRRLAGGLVGMKPQAFSFWVFDLLNAQPGDELVDVFPGTGAVGEAWRAYQAQTRLTFGAGAHEALALDVEPAEAG